MRTIFVFVVMLVASAPAARAGTGMDGAPTPCDRDPKCYGRELALALTGSHAQHAVVFARLVDFEPGRLRVYSKSREKIQAITEAWQQQAAWSVITVRGYAASPELAQRRADKIRGYFIRYGVPADLVVAVAQPAQATRGPGTVGLSIAVCEANTPCARLALR